MAMNEFGGESYQNFQENLNRMLHHIEYNIRTKKGRNEAFEILAGVINSSLNMANKDHDYLDMNNTKRYGITYQILSNREL